MSQENVEIARSGYEHFIASGDVLPEILDPDVILDMSTFGGWVERQEYHGVDGLREFVRDWLEPWDDFEFHVEELLDADEKVVAVVRQAGSSHASGVRVDMHLAHGISFRRGKQYRVEMYDRPDEALKAAGLRQ